MTHIFTSGAIQTAQVRKCTGGQCATENDKRLTRQAGDADIALRIYKDDQNIFHHSCL
jgi:hypothetical protein